MPVKLDVSHMTSGYALRLRYAVRLDGPCMRCLEDADAHAEVDSREVDHPGGGDELTSPYVDGVELDLAPGRATRWCWQLPPRSCAARSARACALRQNLNDAGARPRA